MAELRDRQDETQALVDAVLLMGITLARFEAGAQMQAELALSALWGELQALLTQYNPLGADTVAQQLARVKALLRDTLPAIRDAFSVLAEAQSQVREHIAVWAAETLVAAMQPAFPRSLRSPSDAMLTRLAMTGMVLGASATDWWGRQAATVQQRLGDTLRQAILQERAPQAVQADLTGVRTAMVNAAEKLVQTSLAAVAQQSMAAVHDANAGQIGAIYWQTALDSDVCLRCMALSMLGWTAGHTPIGHRIPWPGDPPLHFACRCEALALPEGAAAPPQQRFETWLRTQPVAEQRAILGPGRFQLWQAGRLRLRQLVDQRHRPLTLEALRSDSAA